MHVSFSAIKDYKFCPHYYNLTRVKKIKKFTGNIYTAFGTAIHSVCENVLLKFNDENSVSFFKKEFKKEVLKLDQEIRENIDKKTYDEFVKQGEPLCIEVLPFMMKTFGKFKVVSTEQEISQIVKTKHDLIRDYDFKGYVDLVIKTEDDKIHVIDWKTCSWGWDSRKKADTMTTYQLTYYKHFISEILSIPPEMIETHFVLLKRTGKKDRLELVKVSNGKIKTKNALNLLENTIYNLDSENFIKNRLSCGSCDFRNTPHCP